MILSMPKTIKITLSILCLFITTACTPVTAKRGNMLEQYQIEEVKPGIHTQSDVLHLIGSPTTVSTFNPRVWYYIGQETEKKGIFDSKIVDEKIVEVVFDDKGVVQKIQRIDNKRADIPYSRAKTPTHGNELTIPQQLLGNLGRFNTPKQ